MEPNVELIQRIESLMQDERWCDAIAVIQSDTFYSSDFEQSWNLGWAYFKVGDYASAQQHLTRATELTPTNAVGWWALGLAQREHGSLADAERNLKHALALQDSSVCRSALAIALMQRGKTAEAEQIHLSGLELRPESAKRWKSYACFLDDVGRAVEANAAYKKARYFEGA